MIKLLFTTLLALGGTTMAFAQSTSLKNTTLKIATFNVSMEALNYVEYQQGEFPKVSDKTLNKALSSDHQQIKNIAEIIQTVNPDIILLNEFDNQDNSTQDSEHYNLKKFINLYLNQSQNGQPSIDFPFFYQGSVNTGINSGMDIDGDGAKGKLPGDGYGYGYFPGHYGMLLLSKYPINIEQIRTFQYFKWHDMPNALMPTDPVTNKPWYSLDVWQKLRLSSKSHWDIPVEVNGKVIHILASHPTPPVFDGPENRHGKRNHDEIRFWQDYISPNKASYIYDDNGVKGGIKSNDPFVLLGDLNATTADNGNAIKPGIFSLLSNKNIQDAMPQRQIQRDTPHTPENLNMEYFTSSWGMRVDYVLPSLHGFSIKDSGIFWPLKTDKNYPLVKDRKSSSDHRLVWVEVTTKN